MTKAIPYNASREHGTMPTAATYPPPRPLWYKVIGSYRQMFRSAGVTRLLVQDPRVAVESGNASSDQEERSNTNRKLKTTVKTGALNSDHNQRGIAKR